MKLGKDDTNTTERTNVVQKFSCNNCKACYIGEIKRSSKTRILGMK